MGTTDGTVGESAAAPSRPRGAWLKTALGYLLAAACLFWVFHDIEVGRLWGHLAGIRWWLVALAVACDILSYVCQGLRWQMLLRPVGRLSPAEATRAVYVGLFANEMLPMKLGEFVRAYLVARWLGTDVASVVPSMLVERLLDGVWLALGVALAALLAPLPGDIAGAGDVLGIVTLLATALFIFNVIRKAPGGAEGESAGSSGGEKFSGAPLPSIRRRLSGLRPLLTLGAVLARLAYGLRSIGLGPLTYGAFALSLALLLLQSLSFWLVMLAYGLRLPFLSGAVVFLVVHLCTAVPNAPANVGTYQFFTVMGLALFGVDKTQAAGFSAVVFALLTAPLWLLGFWALRRSGTTLYSLRHEVGSLLWKKRAAPPTAPVTRPE